MTELLGNLTLGLQSAFTVANVGYCFLGVVIGTLVGVLPGLGPVATLALLLPLTYALDPTAAVIMLAGIYYGSQYGGSTTAILMNIPGEAASLVTCIDGHKLALKGRAASALGIAAIASFSAGTVATFLIALASPALSEIALYFGAAEYFSLMVLGLVGAVALSNGDVLKAIAMVITGLLLGLIGTDINTGELRFTLDTLTLQDGVDFAVISMGFYGVAEVLKNLQAMVAGHKAQTLPVKSPWPETKDLKDSAGAIGRGTILGSLMGLLPGGGAMLASFASYTLEKRIKKTGETPVGEGNIRAVAAPEAANNAGAQTSFIPMLTLGLPSNAVMALLMGALIIQNITPGPQVIHTNPELFWGLIVSMWIGNLFLVVLNLPLAGLWAQILRIPYSVLYPVILAVCAVGVYSINYNVYDIVLMAAFALLGYIFYQLRCEPAPLILGFVLGPMMEENLRRAMLLSRGDASVFFTSPISCVLLAIAFLLLAATLIPKWQKTRQEAFSED